MHPKIGARCLDRQQSDVDAVDVARTTTPGRMGSLVEPMVADDSPGVDPTSGGDIRKMPGALGATAPVSPTGAELRTIVVQHLGAVGPMLWELRSKLGAASRRPVGDAADRPW